VMLEHPGPHKEAADHFAGILDVRTDHLQWLVRHLEPRTRPS
jgi:hypothetical protein